MSNKHNKKHNTIPQRYPQGFKASRPQAPQPKGYETPKEWMQFLGYFARSVADAVLTASGEVGDNGVEKPIGNASDTKNIREQLTGAIDIDRYSSLENSINTLRDSNNKEHNSLRKEWRQDIRNTKQDIETQITQNREEANNGIESSNKKINRFLTVLSILVALVVFILGLVFKSSDDNIQERVNENKTEIKDNRRLIEENRERIIRLEEKDSRQKEEVETKQRSKKK